MPKKKGMNYIWAITALFLIIIAFMLPIVFTEVFAETIVCHASRILHIIQLEDIIVCLEDRITILENAPSGSGNATILNDLGDVVISSPTDDQYLRHDGTKWINESVSAGSGNSTILEELGDVCDDVTPTTHGRFLRYSDPNNCWHDIGAYINDMEDVNSPTANNKDVLTYNSSSSMWEPEPLPSSNGKLIGQTVIDVDLTVTKTNIGTSYVDVYTTSFNPENRAVVDFTNVTYIQVVYQWDYVGTGNQQCRWVDANNNSNVMYEDNIFPSDRDPDPDTGFFAKPSWMTGFVTIEWQCKSTVAGDDPIARGYTVRVK